MEEGEIEVDSIIPMALDEITPALARECGFAGVEDLLKVARHGRGENVYLVRFHYVPGQGSPAGGTASPGAASARERNRPRRKTRG
jgi:hypothetical protein